MERKGDLQHTLSSNFPQCANSGCGANFNYRTGRLFHLRHPHGKGLHSVEHFWLCQSCDRSEPLKSVLLHPCVSAHSVLLESSCRADQG